MSNIPVLRFIQRLDSYSRAFSRLEELVQALASQSVGAIFSEEEGGLNAEITREALIKRFEFTQELSWNLIKDYLTYQGETEIAGSRDAYRKGLKAGLINDEQWMNMISDRNLSAHDYNDQKAAAISERIINKYYPLMWDLLGEMRRRRSSIPEEELR